MRETRPPQGAQAALRAIRLLKLFTPERPEMSLSELSRGSGLNKTTTHRLLRAIDNNTLLSKLSVSEQGSEKDIFIPEEWSEEQKMIAERHKIDDNSTRDDSVGHPGGRLYHYSSVRHI